jgi:aspartate-semialdehyde dehydrogenase
MPATEAAAAPQANFQANSHWRLRRSPPGVAIVGATGAVGAELLSILTERDFPVRELRLLASPRSAGRTLTFHGHDLGVDALKENSFADIDLALFSAGSGIAREWAPAAARAGAVVIDNSSAFRMNPAVPLVVPEINTAALAGHDGIIANPNCAAIIAITPLWPIHRRYRIRRLILSTYQAASGAGAAAMAELEAATRAHLTGDRYAPRVLPHPYAFNLFSHDTAIDPATGYNDEETKVVGETRKIFGDSEIRVGVTCVRVPVLRAHAVAVTLECERPIDPGEARALIADAPGCRLVDDRERNHFPMPLEATGQDDILVGRIRRDNSDPSGHSLCLFVAGDQLRKGAALNAVQIAELLLP